ncbi:nucleoside hydrolase [Pandoraea sp. NPDC087047]|uniref:nucleoside hydrolase n=1 Tax=Pandoraea sp. NPDC087047 TaxID=3364390 RepID=UPI00382FE89E
MSVKKIIIDTDPGVDDAVAILLALASPELRVLGITTVAGNVEAAETAANACRVCELAGREDVPVYRGAAGPLLREQIFGKYTEHGGLGEGVLPRASKVAEQEHAVAFLLRQAEEARADGKKITLCTLGPLTNIALALALDPHFADAIEELVMMGGAFTALGNRTPWAEFNVLADPHAVHRVLGSRLRIRMVPLDLTLQVLVTSDRLSRLSALQNRVAQKVIGLLTAYDRNDLDRLGCEGGPLHDPVVIAAVLWPDLMRERSAFVGVEVQSPTTLGHTYADFYGKLDHPSNVRVQIGIHVETFFERLIERLGRYAALESLH